MSGKESQEELAHAKYWDNRYTEKSATEDKYDWLRDCAAVKPFLMKHLPDASRDNPRIVQLGCGNSTLTQDVQSLGYTNQISIDFSQIVIEQMRAKHLGLHWQVMDVRDMGFESASFDIAIDKTTLDAMLYGSLWDPEDEVKKNVKAYVDEVSRILRPGGMWLYVTWRQPHFIKPLLSRPEVWTLDCETLADGGGMLEYYGYILKKLP